MIGKSAQELRAQKVGSAETSKNTSPGGWYQFDRGADYEPADQRFVRVLTREHPRIGSAQADGFVRMGYTYVGPATAEEMQAADAPVAIEAPKTGTVARSEFDALQQQFSDLLASVKASGTSAAPVTPAADGTPASTEAPVKPLSQMNRDELVAHAADNGVEHAPDATKAEIVTAITSAPSAPASPEAPAA